MPRVYTRIPPDQRFWAKVRKSDGCWEWTAAVADTGYGVFVESTRSNTGAHRFSYRLHFGAIPDGLWVLHRCDNKRCVRPDHLFLGDAEANVRDMDSKGRRVNKQVSGTKHHASKLDPDKIAFARSVWRNLGKTGRGANGYWTLARLAALFGVSVSALRSAIVGETWRGGNA